MLVIEYPLLRMATVQIDTLATPSLQVTDSRYLLFV